MSSITKRIRDFGARLRPRRSEDAGTRAERAQRRAQADALRLEQKRKDTGSAGGGA
jgi:hypothetical protein